MRKALVAQHGALMSAGPRDAFGLILWEQVGYMADDEKRAAAFRRLKREVGVTPRAIAAARRKDLESIARDGGGIAVKQRAEKILLLLAVRTVQPMLANPLETVRAAAEEQGDWADGDLALTAGGYATAFVGMSAFGHFTVRSGPRAGASVYVEVLRPSPFQDWHLVIYEFTPAKATEDG